MDHRRRWPIAQRALPHLSPRAYTRAAVPRAVQPVCGGSRCGQGTKKASRYAAQETTGASASPGYRGGRRPLAGEAEAILMDRVTAVLDELVNSP